MSAWVDHDLNGVPDFVLSGPRSGAVGVGVGIYRPTETGIGVPIIVDGWMSWRDFDGDGDFDVAIRGNSPESEKLSDIYLNRVAEHRGYESVFFIPIDGPPPLAEYRMPCLQDWADLNNDGLIDLLERVSPEGQIALWTGIKVLHHDGLFPDESGIEFFPEDTVIQRSQLVDRNSDGFLDIELSGHKASDLNQMWSASGINRGDGQFDFVVPRHRYHGESMAWGDADNDGELDLFVSGRASDGAIPGGNPREFTGLIIDGAEWSMSQYGVQSNVIWVDIDGDGDQDIFSLSSGTPYVLRNNSSATNSLPLVPQSPEAMHINESVRLSWEESWDENQSGGLTYNVAVRRADRTPVLLPHADLSSGRLNLLQRGNAGSMLHWNLRNLPEGDYEWAVQAVDHAHAGSPFTAWQSFTVQPSPVLAEMVDRTMRVNRVLSNIAISFSDANDDESDLEVSVTSSNTDLVTNESLVVTGTGGNRFVSLMPLPHAVGETTITVTVSDGVAVGLQEFVLTVFSDPPAMSLPQEITLNMNSETPRMNLQISDSDYPSAQLELTVSSSNPSLLGESEIDLTPSGSTRYVTLRPAIGEIGTAVLTFVLSDPAGASSTNEVTVIVIDETPLAVPSVVQTNEDESALVQFSGVDPENQPLAVEVVLPPSNGSLVGDGSDREYTPNPNYFGPDAIIFRVFDGRTYSEIAEVSIDVLPVADTTEGVLGLESLGNGQHRVRLQAEPLSRYRIDRSTDLKDWFEWATVRSDVDGNIELFDIIPRQQRFFRAVPLDH